MPSITTADLRVIVEALSRTPFNKTKLSVIELHDHLPHPDLVQLINEVIAHIDHTNPNSPHKIDIRNELPEVTGARIAGFLFNSLKWQLDPMDVISKNIVTGSDRGYLLQILHYVLQDIPKMQQVAYKSRFCQPVDVPFSISGDEQIRDLVQQLSQQQIEFCDILDQAEQLHVSGQAIGNLKRDVSQMEDEKTLVLGKIQRMQRKVADIPNANTWLNACRALRTEQDRELNLNNQIKDFKLQCTTADERVALIKNRIKGAQDLGMIQPTQILDSFHTEVQNNRSLVNDQLSKELDNINQTLSLLQKLNDDPPMPMSDLVKLEHEIDSLNEQVKDLSEKRTQTNQSQDKLGLFRQQVSVLVSKKTNTAQKLSDLKAELERAKQENTRVKEELEQNPKLGSIPKGEEFKAYIADLRTKSNTYKTKRGILTSLTSEIEIAIKTREILTEKRNVADRTMQMLEQRHGVSGLRKTQLKLEQISDRKGSVDQEKASVVQEMTDLVNTLTSTINTKKQSLAPKISDLKLLKSTLAGLEADCEVQKRNYNTKVLSLETEIQHLELTVREMEDQVLKCTSQWHAAVHQSELLDREMDLVMDEMNRPGSSRDMYLRQISHAQALHKSAADQLARVQALHEQNLVQVKLFADIQSVLMARIAVNKRLLKNSAPTKGSNSNRAQEIVTLNQQRLVIS